MAIIGIDFDGCCVVALPEAGTCDIETGATRVLRKLVAAGHSLILWTCRNEDPNNPYNKYRSENSLQEAIRWFAERDIPLSGINSYLGENRYVGRSRKLLVDLLIDDTALGIQYKVIEVDYINLYGERKRTKTFHIDWFWAENELIKLGFL